jgi:soluble lytic murein transglycosylase-like protein
MRIFIAPIMGMAMLVSGCNSIHEEPLKISSSKPTKSEVSPNIKQKIEKSAKKYNVPYKLASSIIDVESKYDPNAYGRGTYGLGQIKCGTAKGIGFTGNCKNLFDTDTNLEYSIKYLSKALGVANGNECYAATLYNRGLGNKPTSSAYCRKVLAKY